MNDVIQTDEYGNVKTEMDPNDIVLDLNSTTGNSSYAPEPESVELNWQDFQTKASGFLTDLPNSIITFLKSNRQPMSTLGLLALLFLGLKVFLAGLDAIDDIPLVSFVLKLVGLFYVGRFIWRYLMKASDRQELAQKIETVKADVLGSH